jgi:hypothetical protein
MKPPTDPKASAARYDDGVPHHQPGVHDELHNEDVLHEHVDVNLRAVGMSVAVLAASVLVSLAAMYLLFGWFERDAAAADPPVSPLAAGAAEMPRTTTQSPVFNAPVTTAPQLLTNEPMALEKHRAQITEQLQSYGWVSQPGGAARVPIDDAKKLLIGRGLPVREGAEPGTFTVRPWVRGESSGGRAITQALPERSDAAPPAEAPAAKPHGSGH